MTNVLQREIWNGPPEQLRELFALTKQGRSPVRLTLWSNPLGWELRLEIGESFLRSQVCRGPEEIAASAEEWKAGLLERGWQ